MTKYRKCSYESMFLHCICRMYLLIVSLNENVIVQLPVNLCRVIPEKPSNNLHTWHGLTWVSLKLLRRCLSLQRKWGVTFLRQQLARDQLWYTAGKPSMQLPPPTLVRMTKHKYMYYSALMHFTIYIFTKIQSPLFNVYFLRRSEFLYSFPIRLIPIQKRQIKVVYSVFNKVL